jgi:hypothetical protein
MIDPSVEITAIPDRYRRMRRELDEARGVIRELLDFAEDDRMDYDESCKAIVSRAREYLRDGA